MNVLVVGGTRFFGIPMVEKLIADGHDVTIATRGLSDNPFKEVTKQIVMDRSDFDSVKSALDNKEFDVIIDKIAYSSNDVKNLLSNVSCKKYIQMSSCSVYSKDKENIKESEFNPQLHKLVWMNRNDDYAEGKRQAERATLEFLDSSQCVFVRYPIVMGENDYTGRLKFYINHIINSEAMFIDDLDCGMEFIHEKEAGYFIAHLVNTTVTGAINGSSKGMISTKSLVEFIEKQTNRKAILDDFGDAAPYNGALANISYDTTKARDTGFAFSSIDDWIYELIHSNLQR
ncbi:Nucleoside-diphosphate-sugar epimerase [Pseudobutyrivibrio sp. C4]|uniref:NAD-dependent epimerase/dehydratase family protein n=1 Tax=Pseudobutyrivibrio sp. C4 TaxID=1520803 RepID=UPI0008D0513E|nr:NAD-dependent epimerase/dehydratase family protein [Pseudobutyrivibrio sp. C4]SET06615.1 Nucleoside-diphosphate-sugar epimerase [Pseudobutyrivibrio sp. C4]